MLKLSRPWSSSLRHIQLQQCNRCVLSSGSVIGDNSVTVLVVLVVLVVVPLWPGKQRPESGEPVGLGDIVTGAISLVTS